MTLTFTLERHQDVIDRINGHVKAGRLRSAAAAPMTFGVDVSHWQGSIDFRKVAAAGFSFVVMKATEGTGFVDPNFATYRTNVRATPPLVPLMYHFVGSADPTAEADFFVKTVGSLAVGEGAAEDYEPANPPPDPVGWSRTWLDRVKARLGVPGPWIYMNSSTEARCNWSPLARDYGLWLAKYDNDPDMDPVTHWPSLAAEQYWDKGTVPGISGPVDVDVFYGTREQLLAYCKGGASPTPQEDDMTPEQDAILRDVQAKLDGYGYRIERIDEGQHGGKPDPWGYGTRIEQTQADVAAIKAALAQLVQQSPVSGLTEDMLEKALRDVLGSLDNKS